MLRIVRSHPVAVLLVVGLSLAGCGSEPEQTAGSADEPAASTSESSSPAGSPSSSPTPTPSPTAAPLPRCSEVWVDGKAFPSLYEGCRQDGKVIEAKPLICESMQRLYVHGRHFWAVGGALVVHTEGPYTEDPRYVRTHHTCTA